ncbi:hypothetical protein ACHMZP_32700 [Rhodococcus baikonurensis]|uniref:hypothetical protein n=1 Tax=Rhodococcus baikonurensis TaxID=172041 RepID=UPI003791B8E7
MVEGWESRSQGEGRQQVQQNWSCHVRRVVGEYRCTAGTSITVRQRVRETPLHSWAAADPGRCFDDLFNLVVDPGFLILEADFDPSNYGFRPERRCQGAIEEFRFYAARGYEQVSEGDIAACFDKISNPALMDPVAGSCDRPTNPTVGRGRWTS